MLIFCRRSKFSHDPNNTNWSRSESKYGQRILQAQGWKPGEDLGAKDASYAKYHTIANSSHIKVTLREDKLGLGARVGVAGGEWETTGLGRFRDLLGRLNGKTEEELEREQRSRESLKRSNYAEQRWGTLRFVSGGLLVGDKTEEVKEEEGKTQKFQLGKITPCMDNVAAPMLEERPRDADDLKSNSKKKSKKPGKVDAPSRPTPLGDVPLVEEAAVLRAVPTACAVDKVLRRAEKVERKVQRKLRREARLEKKTHTPAKSAGPSLSAQAPIMDRELVGEGAAFGHLSNGIQVVRHRHIKHKKMAMMDSKALNEVGSSFLG